VTAAHTDLELCTAPAAGAGTVLRGELSSLRPDDHAGERSTATTSFSSLASSGALARHWHGATPGSRAQRPGMSMSAQAASHKGADGDAELFCRLSPTMTDTRNRSGFP
jgi:hypothetical protein